MKSVHFDDLKQSGCRCNGFHGFAHQSEKTQLVRIGFQKISYLITFRGKQLFADFLFCSLACIIFVFFNKFLKMNQLGKEERRLDLEDRK